MADIFRVYLGSESGELSLNLPAMPWALLDARERLRLKDGEVPYISIEEYYRFDSLCHILEGDCSLGELNVLAQKLSELDDIQSIAFEGLLRMEGGRAGLPRIIDLAYSTDCCHVVGEALNDAQLGRFYAENGFVAGTEGLPDELFDLLDFQRIGRELRQGEGGVFTKGGYVLRHSEPAEVYRTLDLTLREPDYAVLLELENGERLRLPSVQLPDAAPVRCLDCRIPALTDAITEEKDLHVIARFAQTLAGMEPERLTACTALLEAANCRDLGRAAQLADTLDEYIFTPQCATAAEVALGELSIILSRRDAELIAPYLDLHQYGQALIRRDGSVLTDYGLLDRGDGGPIQRMEDEPRWGGMEMK